jgi:hypothetical protein
VGLACKRAPHEDERIHEGAIDPLELGAGEQGRLQRRGHGGCSNVSR